MANCGVKASVARTMTGAVTVPRLVRTQPLPMLVTAVFS